MKICFAPRAAMAPIVFAMLGASSAAVAAEAPRETVAPAYAYPIANVPGKTITSLIVTYPPGGKTPTHRHGKAFVVGYVLEGSIRSKLDNGEVRTFKAGESWTEKPGTVHTVSENASATESAKVLAVLIHDAKAKDLLTFDQSKGKPSK
jgi:quercetin dioxygenase-like cupin family protein